MSYRMLLSSVIVLMIVIVIGCSDSSTNSTDNNTNQPPAVPSNPVPEVGDTLIARNATLHWLCSDTDSNELYYKVFLNTDSNFSNVGFGTDYTIEQSFQPATYLDFSTKYFWKIIASDNDGNSTSGPVWYFTTIPFDSTFVSFPDTSFRRAIVNHLINRELDDSIYVSDVDTVTELLHIGGNQQSGDYHIASIEGIQYLISLARLSIYESPLLSDISPLQNLTEITDLSLGYNNIADISPLQNLVNINNLDISHNQISDISYLANLTHLSYLYAYTNSISDISVVARFHNLKLLDINTNSVSVIDSLAHLDSLQFLIASSNNISDITPLQYLQSIKNLSLDNNNISDIKPLVDNIAIDSGVVIDLTNNPLSDSSLNVYIPELIGRNVTVRY